MRWSPGTTRGAVQTADGSRAISRRRSRDGPILFSVRDAGRAARVLRFPLGGLRQARGARRRRALCLAHRGQAGQPGHLLRPRRLTPRRREACARAPPGPARSCTSRPRPRRATTAGSTSPSASAGASPSPTRERLFVVAPRARSRAGRRRPEKRVPSPLRRALRRQLAGRGRRSQQAASISRSSIGRRSLRCLRASRWRATAARASRSRRRRPGSPRGRPASSMPGQPGTGRRLDRAGAARHRPLFRRLT